MLEKISIDKEYTFIYIYMYMYKIIKVESQVEKKKNSGLSD